MNSNNAQYGSTLSLDSLEARDSRNRRRIAYRVNDAYSSTDESETDGSSATSGYSSRASSPHDLSDVDDVDDGVVFESTKPLIHTLEYILCVQEMCDVTFLAGKKKEPVYGLQAVMGSRSRYFYQLFLSKKKTRKSSEDKRGFFSFFKKKAKKTESVPATQVCHLGANHVTIPIPDYDHEVLRRVVSFVHLGHVTVTTDTVIGLICAATEFQLDDLRKACWEFVDMCMVADTLPALLKSGAQYRKRPHVKLFLQMISKMR
ncbi:serine-enriched protein-like [Haliotis cracherodii]|uniref:serine-enriched protein-like n=1 Tax=Haliotis cracherodii TaxID=6455 RepID=UPI0039ECA675